MKKFLTVALSGLLAASALVGLSSCGEGGDEARELQPVAKEDLKIGLICLHDDNSTYDKNFIDAMYTAMEELGIAKTQLFPSYGIPETNECYEKAADLADQGCQVVFADSFGHESHMVAAAEEFPNVQFCHATGVTSYTTKLKNFHNAFASIYEGRYLAGVAAGMKLKEMNEADATVGYKMGYVGAYPYAEVKSGYTSFYLGAKSVCPEVTMDVSFTNSWFSIEREKNEANKLIAGGARLISQHADSMGAPSACEEAKVPNVSYNISTKDSCGNSYLIASRINWVPYFKYMIQSVIDGTEIAKDWCGTLQNGAVTLEELNEDVAAAGTAEKLAEVKTSLMNGTLKVFDTSKFTVKGETLSSYLADIDGDFTGETNVIIDGVFMESSLAAGFRSAPYFDIDIDGITLLTNVYDKE